MSETFLDGRVKVAQPESGFRSGLDAVMLAAAVPAASGQTALELGAGSGTASLCLAARVCGVTVTGVERDEGLAALARDNAAANGMDCKFVAADIFALPPELKRDFDSVLANPPFHGEGQISPDEARAAALMDGGKLSDWLKLGLQRTVSGGFFTAILRGDRLNEALAALPQRGLCAFPLWPRAGENPKRVIVQVRKGSGAPFALLPGLILHRQDGSWTVEADDVLRRGNALALSGARL
ncbi:MAG TPA: methyltransferase [Rhizomicrobium sp.]|nr:methyltransferase [Rhizomicrobium sp.]